MFGLLQSYVASAFIVRLVLSANVQSFPDLIEAGSIQFNMSSGIGCGYFSQILPITFITAKANNAYDEAFAFEMLDIGIYSQHLSIRAVLQSKLPSGLSVLIDGQCRSSFNSVTVRYLVVIPPLTASLNLRFVDGQITSPYLLKQNTYWLDIVTPLSITANQTKTAHFLSGITVYNTVSNSIDIYSALNITDTHLTLKVTTNNQFNHTYLTKVCFYVVLINTQITLQNITSTFETGTLDNYNNNYAIYYTNNNTVFNTSTTFFGIRAFKNKAASGGLAYTAIIRPSVIQFGSDDNIAIYLINCVFTLSQCTSASARYLFNNSCIASCPATYFSSNYTCKACSAVCLNCSMLEDNCTSCVNTSYLNGTNCTACPDLCVTCSAASNCTSCANRYYNLNGSCLTNCSSLSQCTFCSLINENPYCSNCSTGYNAILGKCSPICGDGMVIGTEVCDDNNTLDGDGCSSTCTQQDYFTCAGNKSVCLLSSIVLQYAYTVKVADSNSFSSFYKVQPKLQILSKMQWMNGLSFSNGNIAITGCSYDSSKGQLTIIGSYSADVTSQPVTLRADYANMSNLTANISAATISQSLVAQNNLSLQYFSSNAYQLASFIKYISILLSCLSLLMLIGGYFGGKLIALEHIAVLQVTFLSLGSVHEASPTYAALRDLRLSIGNTMLNDYDYSANINRELKGSYYSSSMFQAYNVALITVLLPILVALTLKILSLTLLKSNQILDKLWPKILGQMTFYGLIFTAYFLFSQLIVYFILVAGGTSAFMGLGMSFCQSLLMLVFCYYLNQQPMYFGDFKKKFQKFNICSYFYSFVVLEKFLTSLFIIILRNSSFGLALALLPIALQLIFVAKRKPYVCGDDKRPVINLAITIIILFCVLVSNILPNNQMLQIYIPIVASLLLMLTLGSNIYYLVVELKEIYLPESDAADVKKFDTKVNNEQSTLMVKMFNMEQPETVEEKNRVQFELFKQKFINDNQEMNLIFNSKIPITEEKPFEKERINYEWEHYPNVASRMPILERMRAKAKQQVIKQNMKQYENI